LVTTSDLSWCMQMTVRVERARRSASQEVIEEE
jgi:hypothetical protein